MCFFQEKFQESLKRLKQEQQEAEKLKAVITEKRTHWKVKEITKGVLGQESGHGSQGQGDLVLSVPSLARRAFLCLFLHCSPSKQGYCSWCSGKREGELANEHIKREPRFFKTII